jgi:hypothetical protein
MIIRAVAGSKPQSLSERLDNPPTRAHTLPNMGQPRQGGVIERQARYLRAS